MEVMAEYIWLVPLFPLLGFLINAFNYKRFKGTLAGILASVAVFAAFVVALGAFFEILSTKQAHTVDLFNWIAFGKVAIPFSFLIDQLSVANDITGALMESQCFQYIWLVKYDQVRRCANL